MATIKENTRAGPRHSATATAPAPESLTVLTRANHDMRSPLSVILGVFELFEDGENLTDAEQRYLSLGMQAANDLLALADSLRLYSALQRELVTLETSPVDPGDIAFQQLLSVVSDKPITVTAPGALAAGCYALADASYLAIALKHLCRQLVAQHQQESGVAALTVRQALDAESACIVVVVEPSNQLQVGGTTAAGNQDEVLEHSIGALNAIRLIELMGGNVRFPTPDSLSVSLAAVAAKRR